VSVWSDLVVASVEGGHGQRRGRSPVSIIVQPFHLDTQSGGVLVAAQSIMAKYMRLVDLEQSGFYFFPTSMQD
jgi:hypothetical protein